MRKVISGARYDTETAKQLAKWEQHQSDNDATRIEEELYRTKSGNWFLYGKGGAATIYASHKEDGRSAPGEQIVPLSEDVARQWAEQHLSGEQVNQIYSALNSDLTQVVAYLPSDLLKKLDSEKAESRRSRSDIIIDALRKYL